MAEQISNPEEQALRRRARRRLVGSLALALLAVVVLPMIFEPEPKPLGDDVEILIPGQDTPFVPVPGSVAPAKPVRESAPAPVVTPAPEILPPPTPAGVAKPVQRAAPAAAEKPKTTPPAKETPVPSKDIKAPAKAEKPVAQASGEARPAVQQTPPAVEKPAPAVVDKKPGIEAAAKSEAKSPAKSPEAVATGSHYLQLGAFGAEANARQLADKVKSAGVPVQVLAGQGGHRVRVGPYPSKEKAVEAQSRLKAKGFSPVLVTP